MARTQARILLVPLALASPACIPVPNLLPKHEERLPAAASCAVVREAVDATGEALNRRTILFDDRGRETAYSDSDGDGDLLASVAVERDERGYQIGRDSDHDGDGNLDETWTGTRDGPRLVASETDEDADGAVDAFYQAEFEGGDPVWEKTTRRTGRPYAEEITETEYENGNAVLVVVTRDGVPWEQWVSRFDREDGFLIEHAVATDLVSGEVTADVENWFDKWDRTTLQVQRDPDSGDVLFQSEITYEGSSESYVARFDLDGDGTIDHRIDAEFGEDDRPVRFEFRDGDQGDTEEVWFFNWSCP